MRGAQGVEYCEVLISNRFRLSMFVITKAVFPSCGKRERDAEMLQSLLGEERNAVIIGSLVSRSPPILSLYFSLIVSGEDLFEWIFQSYNITLEIELPRIDNERPPLECKG